MGIEMERKKQMMLVLAALVTAFARATETSKAESDATKPTREQRIARRDRLMMEMHGGLLPAKGTPAGRIVVANAQSKVSPDNFDYSALKGGSWLRGVCTVVPESAAPAKCIVPEMDRLRKRHRADFLLLVTDDPSLPASLVAVEAQWAIMNIAALEKGAATPEVTRIRARNEFTRVFCMLCGGFSSQFKAPLTNFVVGIDDLDSCLADPPVDVNARLRDYLDLRGIKPERRVTYRQACREGWAPAPTNEVQRAIWEKVHAIPAKPMRIEFDPKRGR